MYLIAVKSFARYLPLREIVALNDGSLTPLDRTVLQTHLPGLRLVPIVGLGSEHCPKGGCWERLLFIAGAVSQGYVVQLDADTLTLGDPVEVREAVREGTCFTLGTKMGREIVSAAEAAEAMQPPSDGRDPMRVHIQVAAERALGRLEGTGRRYVRGNAGFAGYAQDSFRREDVEDFSREMASLLGPTRWSEWGSEQFTSNYFVANAPSARILPSPDYCRFDGPGLDWETGGQKFLHFMGTTRFQGGTYARVARRVIREFSTWGTARASRECEIGPGGPRHRGTKPVDA
jgi:hypothetical protein